jgi:hypothetical protein
MRQTYRFFDKLGFFFLEALHEFSEHSSHLQLLADPISNPVSAANTYGAALPAKPIVFANSPQKRKTPAKSWRQQLRGYS